MSTGILVTRGLTTSAISFRCDSDISPNSYTYTYANRPPRNILHERLYYNSTNECLFNLKQFISIYIINFDRKILCYSMALDDVQAICD